MRRTPLQCSICMGMLHLFGRLGVITLL
ncbi:hypothetical protein BOS5A_10737 [Bosea sp. EC-HK365B]|nr:hypothetical protein BOS5A_10737 [Bosea sp. EC-HK365B]VXC54964.1 hypothetical protein BOSE127_190424 [Bosea sp. 127]